MHGLARLIAAAIAVLAACRDAPAPTLVPPVQRPGADGLVAFLVRRHSYPDLPLFGACIPTQAEREQILTSAYRAYEGEGLSDIYFVWGSLGTIHVRALYANDLEVPASLRRTRPAFPVGQPPLVASIEGKWLETVFVFRHHWLCVSGIDGTIAQRLTDDACRAAYLRSSDGRCLDFSAPLASAVMEGDAVARERLCTLMVEHGCGSVPAEAPLPTEHVKTQ